MFICCAVVGDRVRSPYVYIYMLGSSDSDSQRVSEPSSLLILAARLSFASPTHILCIVRCCVVSPLAYYYFIVSALLASALEWEFIRGCFHHTTHKHTHTHNQTRIHSVLLHMHGAHSPSVYAWKRSRSFLWWQYSWLVCWYCVCMRVSCAFVRSATMCINERRMDMIETQHRQQGSLSGMPSAMWIVVDCVQHLA